MTRRRFVDASGLYWDVWDVLPDDVLRASAYDRRSSARASESEAPTWPILDPALEGGWLCFQSDKERRRFTPIPPHWEEVPDGVLRVMLEIATRAPAPATEDPRAPLPSTE